MFILQHPLCIGGQEPLALRAWSRGSSAGFPRRVAFVSAPEASLLARENKRYWVVMLLTTAVLSSWPFCTMLHDYAESKRGVVMSV